MPPDVDTRARGGEDEIWVPITLHLPLGFAKQWQPQSCVPSALLCGPFAIIFLAQCSNTVLVPVLPFLVKEVGGTAVAYGALQSTLWTSQTVLAPVLGFLSDRVGRKSVIVFSLLVSATGNGILGMAESIRVMWVARVISGLGFQIALFRAYFADTSDKGNRTSKFGLIGVIQGFSLFGGPAIGGIVAQVGGGRCAVFLSSALCVLAAFIGMCWTPESVDQALRRKSITQASPTHKTVGGVKMVKIDLGSGPNDNSDREEGGEGGEGGEVRRAERSCCTNNRLCRCIRKAYKLAIWLAKYDLYPLMTLNFFFRFAFAAYKSIFAFFCAARLGYGAKEVGALLSGMGIAGIGVQGVLVNLCVSAMGEERTLVVAMTSTSLGFALLSYATGVYILIPALSLVALGYGLAVPCLSALFANVPVEQGIMQGFAGAIDRFGQAFGPILGGSLLAMLGEDGLMRWTGISLALVSSLCLLFIGDGCVAWANGSLIRGAGYAELKQQEEESLLLEEEGRQQEEGEQTARNGAMNGASCMNGAPRNGEVAPCPAATAVHTQTQMLRADG